MTRGRVFVARLSVDSDSWDWPLYRWLEGLLLKKMRGRPRRSVTLVDSDGEASTRSVARAEHLANAHPSHMTLTMRGRHGDSATLTITRTPSGVSGDLCIASANEVAALGLRAAVARELDQVRAAGQEGTRVTGVFGSGPGTWLVALLRHPFLIAVAAGLVAGVILKYTVS